MRILAWVALSAAALAAGAPAKGPELALPLDLAARGRVVWIADGERHQILRLDLRTGRVTVAAGTGERGSAGDGGPATRAQLDEVVALALDAAGNLYAADFGSGRLRRIAPGGTIATVARVPGAGAVAVEPGGRRLAIASLDGGIFRLDQRTGRLSRFARADNPHGLAYERDGGLLVAERSGLRRFAADGGSKRIVAGDFFKVHAAAGGAVYVLGGGPGGGTVHRVVGGRAVRVAGTGGTTPYVPAQSALAAGILPSDLEVLADGTVLVTQTRPVPALRRLARGRLVTVLR